MIDGQLAIDTNPKALSVYERLLEGTLREFGIGFAVIKSHDDVLFGEAVRYLDELELLEISVVWRGAARTRTMEVPQRHQQ